MTAPRPVAILGGVRIPFCRQNTAYADVGNLGMSVRTLGALVESSACRASSWAKWRWVR
jgi:acetyl-CoA C-acetyltransferase